MTRTVNVGVPAGVDDGATLRLSGEADAGLYGGPAGNLFVQLRVKADPTFTRNEHDLLVDIPLNMAQAALGAEIEAPTLEGPTSLRIPEGTQSGKTFRLRERGVPVVRGVGRGDLIYTVKVADADQPDRRAARLTRATRPDLRRLDRPGHGPGASTRRASSTSSRTRSLGE